MKYTKIITLSLGLIIISALTFVGIANAQSFKTGDSITVAIGETVDSMLFATGTNINIAGTVDGDVYCAGQTITISGTVNGDVVCAGQTVVISGVVDGNVRIGGQTVTISGMVGNSATIGAQDLIVDNSGIINRDLLGGSQNVAINGAVDRDVVAGSTNITINGRVKRNINGGVETLSVGPNGNIGGDVEYIGNKDPEISGTGKIVGTVTRTAPEAKANENSAFAIFIGWFAYVLIAMIALALMLVGLFPRVFKETSLNAIKLPGKTALIGLVACVVTPFLIMVLMMSIIGIPLAVLTMLTWMIIMILSGPFTGYVLGKALMPNVKKPFWVMITGVSVLVFTYFVPIIGFITVVMTSIFGSGMILMESKKLILRTKIK